MRSIDIVNFSGKNFLPINPLSPIVHGLYFSNLVPRVLSYPSIRSERGRRENLGTRLGWVGENPGGWYFSNDNVFSIWCMHKGCIQDGISVCNYEKLTTYSIQDFEIQVFTTYFVFLCEDWRGICSLSDKILLMQLGTKTAFGANAMQKYGTLITPKHISTSMPMQVGKSFP